MKYVFTISLVLIEIWFCNVNGKEIQGRIAGGNFAEKNQFPHHAAIYFGSQFICGGSIISQQIILTAGHCVEDIPVEKLKVVIGTNNLLNLNSAAFLDVEHTRKHESYSFPFNDIALMSLKKPLTFSDSVQKIEIATEDLPVGSDVIAIGFGRETTYGPPSKKLKFNDMIRVNSNKGCYDFVHDGVVCLESEVKNGPCKGDSGGSAVHDGKIIGVTSFGFFPCGTFFDGYTKVSYFADWIMTNVEQISNEL